MTIDLNRVRLPSYCLRSSGGSKRPNATLTKWNPSPKFTMPLMRQYESLTQVLNARLKLLDIERSILAADLQCVHVDFFPMMVRVVFFSVGMMDIGE
jgi:hypothetical protein